MPAAPEPVETPWLRDALTRATREAVDRVAKEARRRPAALDLVFKLGVSNDLHLLWCASCDWGAPTSTRPAALARGATPKPVPAA